MRGSVSGSGGGPAATQRPWRPWVAWVDARRRALERFARGGGGGGSGGGRGEAWRVRVALDALRVPAGAHADWARMPIGELAVYMPNQVRHMIRMDSTLERVAGREVGALPTLPAWRDLRGLRADPDGPWRLPDMLHLEHLDPPSAPARAGPGGGAPAGAEGVGGAGGWGVAARSAPLLAAMLTVLVLVLRCSDNKLFKSRRRPSQEWPTPNVLATSCRPLDESEGPIDTSGGFLEANLNAVSVDLPPPYSECTKLRVNISPKNREEPPPPYSSCYVSFSSTGDGIPSVHFYNNPRHTVYSNRNENGHSSTEIGLDDTGQNIEESSNTGCDVNEEVNACRGLVFENERVIERNTTNEVNEYIPRERIESRTEADCNSISNKNNDNVSDLIVNIDPRSGDSSPDERLRFILA